MLPLRINCECFCIVNNDAYCAYIKNLVCILGFELKMVAIWTTCSDATCTTEASQPILNFAYIFLVNTLSYCLLSRN